MTDHRGDGSAENRQTAAHSANDDTAQTILTLNHALSERLQAMTSYFAAARAQYAKGDPKAAEQSMVSYLEQSDRARVIAERLRASMSKPLP